MGLEKRYVIVKRKDSEEISYLEYDKREGLSLHPKNKIEDLINVNEMIVINPSFINTLVNKKCKKALEKIIKILSFIYEDDSNDDGILEMALDEIEKLRRLVIDKYQKFMKDEEADLLLKKLDILENEVNLRKLVNFENEEELHEGKGR